VQGRQGGCLLLRFPYRFRWRKVDWLCFDLRQLGGCQEVRAQVPSCSSRPHGNQEGLPQAAQGTQEPQQEAPWHQEGQGC
ncbi:hypothetical protein BGX21_007516, partial [Mortierella sp. AD011]